MSLDADSEAVTLQALMQRRDRQLDAARRVAEAVRGHATLDEIVKASLMVAMEAVGGRAGSVLLADEDAQQLVFQMSVGENPVTPGTRMSADQGIAGQVFHTGEPRLVRNIAQEPVHYGGIDSLTGFKTLNMLALPLCAIGGKPFGVLEVLNKGDAPAEDDLAVLTIIASFTALAIEQARLFESARLAEVAHRLQEVGHAIKNMLSPVKLGVDLLEQDLIRVQERYGEEAGLRHVAEATAMVNDAVNRIQNRVRLITEYVKGRAVPVEIKDCRLMDVVKDVTTTLEVVLREHRITVSTEGFDGLPIIQADADRLYTAFYNLLDNAIAEMPEGGRISLRAKLDDDGLSLEVEDNGRGMKPEVRARLFSDKGHSRKAGGTGIGTRIVQDVIRAHGGRISVESEVGRGTTFFLWLPMRGHGRQGLNQIPLAS
jgi:signal transduction histidine kinase